MSKILKFIISTSVYGLILLSTIIISLIVLYSRELPDYDKLYEYKPSTVTRLYAANGQLIEEYATEHRIFIPFNAIPKNVVNAFLAAEDSNYYNHQGIDFKGISRALVQNITNLKKNKSLVGGSTITQQVVKNFLLSDEKSIKRKIQEAILSFRISTTISKDRILELYLNQIFLGNHSYGIVSAAQNYFDKSIEELDISEAAMLAALPKAPSKYNPFFDYDKALDRRNWVINKMFEDSFITQTELTYALQKPIRLKSGSNKNAFEDDYFAEEVRQTILEQYGNEAVYRDGLSIYTTCEPKIQTIAQQTLQEHLIQYDQNFGYRGPIDHVEINEDWPKKLITESKDIIIPVSSWQIAVVLKINSTSATISLIDGQEMQISAQSLKWTKKIPNQLLKVGDIIYVEKDSSHDGYYLLKQIPQINGSIIVMEPHIGKVLALVGGFSYKTSKFNRATQAIRQPGSAFKPFVYLAALENGFEPNTILDDSYAEFSQGKNMPLWKPKNYGNNFLEPITLRTALEKSRNIPTIILAQKVGIKKISEIAQRFNIYNQPFNSLSAALGSIDTTSLKLTNAYAMIVNGGHKISPILIDRIQDRSGKTIYRADNRECPQCTITDYTTDVKDLPMPSLKNNRANVTDEQSAYQLISILNGVTKRGTARKANILGLTIGGKTGTTNDSKDAWFIGFTPDLVITVFVGFDQPKSLGEKISGGTIALPIFNDIAKKILGNTKDKPFHLPNNLDFYDIDLNTGRMANENTPIANIITEAFKEGSIPLKSLPTNQKSLILEELDLTNDQEIKNLLKDLEASVETGI
jgi:penicillin-binding protein 1A